MSRHALTPKAAYTGHRIVVGWDRALGTYYAQVLNLDSQPTEPGPRPTAAAVLRQIAALLHLPTRWQPTETVFIWIGTSRAEVTNPADIIRAVAPYAIIPATLPAALTIGKTIEGTRTGRS